MQPLRVCFDRFELAEAEARLSRDGRPVALAPKAFGVLCALVRRAPELVTKDQLLDEVWGHLHVSESVLKTTVSDLRTQLGCDARQPRCIETVARRGYRFIAALAPVAPATVTSPTTAGTQPAAGPADADATAPLVGRAEALRELHAAWCRASAGQRQVFWIAGEAGVGKTTLIDGFMASLSGAACAQGQCVEQFGAGEPYLPVLEALGSACRNDPALVALMRSVAPTWLLQMPWLCTDAEREALRRDLAGSSQHRMLRELGELLDRHTETRPLLLVTEDLHWSDDASLRLLDHIARRRGPARLMWLASFRLAEVIAEDHPLKGLRHELRLHRLCHEIVLDPFSEHEVADYIERRLPGATLPEALVKQLHAHTDGLPLFVVNVIDDLVSQDALGAMPAAAALPVPEDLAGVIEKRIERLPADQCRLLEAASVCGVEFRTDTLADALARDPAWVAGCCEAIVQRQQWLGRPAVARRADGVVEARHAFRHALYRHVFYQRVGAIARAQMHGRIAASMVRGRAAGLAVAAAELATHFERSHDVVAALRHYVDAAESALQHFAPTEAMSLTAHALTLLPQCADAKERDELEMALLGPRGVAATQLMGVTAPPVVAVYERIQALCGQIPSQISRALEMGLGWVMYARGDYAGARSQAARVEALAAEREDPVLEAAACNLLGATQCLQGELAAGLERLQHGLAVFARFAERVSYVPFVVDLGVAMHARLSVALMFVGRVDQARLEARAAEARAAAVGQPFAKMLAMAFDGSLEMQLERPGRVLEIADALLKAAEDNAFPEGGVPGRWMRGWALAQTGEVEQGHALMVEAFAMQTARGRVGGGSTAILGHASAALVQAGRLAEARVQLDEAFDLARRIGETTYRPELLMVEARLALAHGEREAGLAAMRSAAREALAQQSLWLALTAQVALCEQAGTTADDRDALSRLFATLQEGHDTALAGRARALLAT
ncbi:AAA family ATPase [Variovorax sp. KK3]|uniref:ATP-binding protein n=1 Tax=Variovorax sp. KK3 TaxID=1855728 RepID=UPI00097CA5E9|nr:AAA family ATPase [Variovorax sp. KK3]